MTDSPRLDRYEELAPWDLRLRRILAGRARTVDLGLHRRLKIPDGWSESEVASDYTYVRTIGSVAPGSSFLDVGCGYGAAVVWAARRGANATGVSPSSRQLQVARSAAEGVLPGKCTFIVDSFENLTESATPFDMTCAIESVIHATDRVDALRRMRAVTSADGRLVLVEDVFIRTPKWTLTEIRQVLEGWNCTSLVFDSELQSAFAEAGWSVVSREDLTSEVVLVPRWIARLAMALLRPLRHVTFGRGQLAVTFYHAQLALQLQMHHGSLRYLVYGCKPSGAQ